MIKIDQTDSQFKKLLNVYRQPFEELLQEFYTYMPGGSREQLTQAFHFSLWAHRDQYRYSGEPYFEHLLNVARILTSFRMDATTIIAGLLHDVVEDTDYTLDEIKEYFGKDVALLVNGVTKISEISGRKSISVEQRQAETFRNMMLSMARDIRVIIIKFADRLHNMRTLQHMTAKQRLRIAMETRDVYAPLAHRFGMAKLKSELEDLSFKFIDNKTYIDLARRLNEKKEEREAYLEQVIDPIIKELSKHNIENEVRGRPKHLYSIYNKMQIRSKPLEEIYDLFAIRIIVNDKAECYYVLGIIHNLFIPVYERFKDYIAIPKNNGYQSLHTTVVDHGGRMMEVQIRTRQMHHVAEFGIAAHWRYKEAKSGDNNEDINEKLAWVRQFLDQYD
ncbi:MAG: HD domain-containing protein, partial [Calditrichia bacterium]